MQANYYNKNRAVVAGDVQWGIGEGQEGWILKGTQTLLLNIALKVQEN